MSPSKEYSFTVDSNRGDSSNEPELIKVQVPPRGHATTKNLYKFTKLRE